MSSTPKSGPPGSIHPSTHSSMSSTWSALDQAEDSNAIQPSSGAPGTGLWSLLTAASKYQAFDDDEDDDDTDSSGPHTPGTLSASPLASDDSINVIPPPSQGTSTPTGTTPISAPPSTPVPTPAHPQTKRADREHKVTEEVDRLSRTLAKLVANDYNLPARDTLFGHGQLGQVTQGSGTPGSVGKVHVPGTVHEEDEEEGDGDEDEDPLAGVPSSEIQNQSAAEQVKAHAEAEAEAEAQLPPVPLPVPPTIPPATTASSISSTSATEAPVQGAPDFSRSGPIIVHVLQTEFGKLTRDENPDDTEVFLKETDCALLTETTILGTSQLTSHRLTFHASLLSTRPDLTASDQVVKSGPFVFHPPGLRRKRRRWMELSHNMISVYKNSSDESRARPVRSMLLSAVLKIYPYNPSNPRYTRFRVQKSDGIHDVDLEYDTEESAMEWHREFETTLTHYRMRRRQTHNPGSSTGLDEEGNPIPSGPLAESEDNLTEGVRICVPLHRIDKLDIQPFAEFAIIASMTVNMDNNPLPPLPPLGEGESEGDRPSKAHCPPQWGPSPTTPQTFEFEPRRTNEDGSTNESVPQPPTRELKVLVFKHESGPFLPDYICLAKERRDRARRAGRSRLESDMVTVDFGPLTFADEDEKVDVPLASGGSTTVQNPLGRTASRLIHRSGTSTPPSSSSTTPSTTSVGDVVALAKSVTSSSMTPSSTTTTSSIDTPPPPPTHPGLKHTPTSSSVVSLADEGKTKVSGRKAKLEKKMREMFAIDPATEVFINRAWMTGRVCSSGYLLVSNTFLCFWSKSFTSIDFKLRHPTSQVNTASPLPTTMLGAHLIAVEVRGHPTLQFGITGHKNRDEVVRRILAARTQAQAERTLVPSSTSANLGEVAAGTAVSTVMSPAASSTAASSDSGASAAPMVASPTSMVPPRAAKDDWLPLVTAPRDSLNSDSTLLSRRLSISQHPEDCNLAETTLGHLQMPASPPTFASDGSESGTPAAGEEGPSTPGRSVQLHRSPSSSSSPSRATSPSRQLSSFVTQKLAPLSHTIEFVRSHEVPLEKLALFPRPINIPQGLLRGMNSRHFVCLTIGSRGDVQPYIALCKGLMAEGHRATIVTHEEYRDWVEGFGVGFRAAGGDPGALMKLSVEHSMFSPQFFKESLGKFRGWLNDLLRDAWLQCKDADVLIESPSAMAGVHIAEALQIPYIRAFTMPWTRTTAYPHAFLSPPVELSGSLNYSTYVVFDNVFWTAMSGQVNRWRKQMLGIKRTDIDTLAQTKIPFIYNFSPSVVPKPMDWSDIITISGYWFLDNPDLKWEPSPELLAFIQTAKKDGVPIVYIGFGSITVPHPNAMTRSIIKGVLKAGVRAIISKGWSDRMSKEGDEEVVKFPPECFSLDKVPHDWLFPQIDAAMHHGGAGTTGASLRAGIPTIIKPWFGDQYFWASRVQKLGAGLRVDNLGSSELSNALKRATTDRVMKEKAANAGERIRSENGVREAIRAIYTYLDRAKKDRTTL